MILFAKPICILCRDPDERYDCNYPNPEYCECDARDADERECECCKVCKYTESWCLTFNEMLRYRTIKLEKCSRCKRQIEHFYKTKDKRIVAQTLEELHTLVRKAVV
jgi:hypothetical protein